MLMLTLTFTRNICSFVFFYVKTKIKQRKKIKDQRLLSPPPKKKTKFKDSKKNKRIEKFKKLQKKIKKINSQKVKVKSQTPSRRKGSIPSITFFQKIPPLENPISISIFIHPSVHPSVRLSIHPSVHPSIRSFVCPFVCER